MHHEHPPMERRKLSLLKAARQAGIAVGAIALICIVSFLFFPEPIVNRFIKPRITKAFTEAYPAYSLRIANMDYSVLKNRFGFDSIGLNAVDSTFSSIIGQFSVSGFRWMHLLWGGKLGPQDFAGSVVEIHDIMLNLTQSHYTFRCERFRISVPDSELEAEILQVRPSGDDEQVFAESKFRTTRFRFAVPRVRVTGLACLEMLQGKIYRARSIHIYDAFFDVLVNKDKPNKKETLSPLMLNEMLTSVKETLRVDSVRIMDGRLKYCERFAVGAKPALITFDRMQVLAEGIVNRGDRGAAIYIQAQWKLANAGTMNLLMSIPIAPREFSMHYSGSLSKMDFSVLNSFLEVSDQMRIKAGILHDVTFKVDVASGRAHGTLRGVYTGLKLAVIDKYTRSEKGLSNGFISFIANNFKIRRNNVPDKSGSMKIGEVNYMRQRDDSFINIVWFSLRTGVRDVVGF